MKSSQIFEFLLGLFLLLLSVGGLEVRRIVMSISFKFIVIGLPEISLTDWLVVEGSWRIEL